MNPLEAAMLCRFTKAACPQQAIDEYTPDAWHPLLADIDFEEAKAAVIEAAKERPFVAPAEIRANVRRVRRERLRVFGDLPTPPSELNDMEQAYWLANLKRRIANGEHVERPALPAPGERPVIDFGGVLKSVDEVTA